MPVPPAQTPARSAEDRVGVVEPRATPNDAITHRAMRPVFCPRCGHSYAGGLIVEYWVAHASVYHCWCAFCTQSVDIADANLIVGLEVEH